MKLFTVLMIAMMSACSTYHKPVSSSFQESKILFGFDSDKIKANNQETLIQTAHALMDNSQLVVVVEGHTDPIGSKIYNLDLGDKRARSVKAYFIEKGIHPERIVTVSYGEDNPETSTTTYQDRRQVLIKDVRK